MVSCKEKGKQETKQSFELKKTEKRSVEDLIVFENLLMTDDIKTAEYKNINFDQNGALFSKNIDTYIKIPFSNLDLNRGFNVSFSFKTIDDDGTKPQSLIGFADKYSSASRLPFYVYYPGNKISGVYGKQLFWAENYNAENGYSKEYYDSFQLNKDQFYFVSVNFNGTKVDIYINSELYASFEDLSAHEFKFDHILIGALLSNNELANPFVGYIHGIKVFNQPLQEGEITSIFNSQPEIGEAY